MTQKLARRKMATKKNDTIGGLTNKLRMCRAMYLEISNALDRMIVSRDYWKKRAIEAERKLKQA